MRVFKIDADGDGKQLTVYYRGLLLLLCILNDEILQVYIVGRLSFSRATNFVDFVNFGDIHKICFTKN